MSTEGTDTTRRAITRRSFAAVRAHRARTGQYTISTRQKCELATEANVGLRTIYATGIVLTRGTPALIAAVDQGAITLSCAELVVRLPDAEQDAFVQMAPAEAAERYRQLMAARPVRWMRQVSPADWEPIPDMPSMANVTAAPAPAAFPLRLLTTRRRTAIQEIVTDLVRRVDCHDAVVLVFAIRRQVTALRQVLVTITEPRIQPLIAAVAELEPLVAGSASKEQIRQKVRQVAAVWSSIV